MDTVHQVRRPSSNSHHDWRERVNWALSMALVAASVGAIVSVLTRVAGFEGHVQDWASIVTAVVAGAVAVVSEFSKR